MENQSILEKEEFYARLNNTFKNIKDEVLRDNNRAEVMANIYEDNAIGDGISNKGAALLFGYFKQIPDAERRVVFDEYKNKMAERGFKYNG